MTESEKKPTQPRKKSSSELGNPASDHWLREQFNYDDIEHLIKSGRLLSLVYDIETTDLNPMFGALTQFSGKIVDLQGQIIDEMKLHVQVPEDVAISPQAAIVTQSHPEELYSSENRVAPHIAAGKIIQYFKNPYRILWDQLADQATTIIGSSGKEEEVRVYTIKNADGSKETNIRLHQGGKFLSYQYPDEDRLPDGARTYRDEDGTRWRKISSPAMTHGHNIRRFDDRFLWATLHRAMSDEIFLTHTKKYRRFRVDTLDLAKLVALLDQGGENGFKPGTKINRETGEPYMSFNLSGLMEANTREANPERGLDEGIRMPDGSIYDRRLAHQNADYDVDATIALRSFLRKRAPDVVRIVEENSDFDRIKPFLIGGEGFAMHPLLTFARSVFPYDTQLHFGVCANINEEIEERRQAVMIRTDLDQPLSKYTFRGKKLLDMSVEELAAMLKSQRGEPNALCEVVDLRKNPPIAPAEMAFKRGLGGDPEQHEANRRFILENEELCDKLMKAHTLAMPPMPDYRSIRNPQAEEHLFTKIASPKRYEFEMDGKKVLLTETVHKEWEKALRRNRSIDAVLRRALKPQNIEFETRQDTLNDFVDRMKSINTQLQKYLQTDGPVLPEPDQSFTPPKWDKGVDENGKKVKVPHVMSQEECEKLTFNANEYLWKLRAELMYEFHDNTTRFTVQDSHGHDIPFPNLNKMKQSDLADRLRSGEYKIKMEALNWSSELVARMFRDADRIGWVKDYLAKQGRDEEVKVWENWEKYFEAHRAVRMHGAPHEDPDQQRWMTATKVLKEVSRIRDNLGNDDIRDDDWGRWNIFMQDSDTAEPILAACEELAYRQLNNNPLTDDKLRICGYDPNRRGLPIEHAPYEVPEGAKVLTIDVPDRMLEAPVRHHHVANKMIMLAPTDKERKLLEEAGPDTYLLLRGQQTGRTFLAAKPAVLSSDKIQPNGYFGEVYAEAANRYIDSGMEAPAYDQFLPLAVEALEPVPKQVNSKTQTIKVPRWDDFIATVSPELGYRSEPLTGLVIKDFGFKPKTGEARLQGMVEAHGKPGLVESGWEVPTTVTNVLEITLKEARKRINNGHAQIKAAAELKEAGAPLEEVSVEALSSALHNGQITAAKAKKAGYSLDSLEKLANRVSFTPHDAVHYGYASLTDMRSKITALFVDDELAKNRDDNVIYFVDIKPANKEQMSWHQPAERSMVRFAGSADSSLSPPDATQVRGGPDVERGKQSNQRGA